jgi:hypothetical protein
MAEPTNPGIPAATWADVSMPDRVGTSLGEFCFTDGVPDAHTIERSYRLLDLTRAIDVYLNAIPGASLVAMREGFRSIGVDRQTVLGYSDPIINSATLFLTPNTATVYGTTFLDLREGPVVVENPPNSLSVMDDFWFRFVADLGMAGADKGAGGKYLFLPPGYTGDTPEGYFTYECPTYTNWLAMRCLDGVEGIKKTRIYPLAQADDPPDMEFINFAGLEFNTVHSNNASFYDEVATLVSEEPADSLDPERAGQLAALGIVHGQPFNPDARLKGILDEAAPIAAAMVRSMIYKPRDPDAYYYPGEASWKKAFVGGNHEFLNNGARLLDARSVFHYMCTVVTPAMVMEIVGVGSQYFYTAEDSTGEWLDGGRSYRLRLPANIPAQNFWSVDLYDNQTRSLLQTDHQYPSIVSLSGNVETNDDGTTDIWFGPTAPAGHESNWIQTVPGKGWFTYMRLYGPLESWFDKTWRPGEIEPVEN